MKRATLGEGEGSEDEIWNYRSKRNIQLRQFKTEGKKVESCRVPSAKCTRALVGDSSSQSSKVERDGEKRSARSPRGKKSVRTKKPSRRNGVSPSELPPTLNCIATNLIGDLASPTRTSEGHCPSCQVPFSALTTDSPGWHAMQCLDASYTSPRQECLLGINCSNTTVSHYQKYTHKALALLRAGHEADVSLKVDDAIRKPSEKTGGNSSTSSSKQLMFTSNDHRIAEQLVGSSDGCHRNFILEGDEIQEWLVDPCEVRSTSINRADSSCTTNDSQEHESDQLVEEHFLSFSRKPDRPNSEPTRSSSVDHNSKEDFLNKRTQSAVRSENEDSGLELFRDVSADMFCDDDDEILNQTSDNKFSCEDETTALSNQSSLSSVTESQTNRKGSEPFKCSPIEASQKSEMPSQSRFIHKKIGMSQPNSANRLTHTQKSKRNNLTGQGKNLQQPSISMFFRNINDTVGSSVKSSHSLEEMTGKIYLNRKFVDKLDNGLDKKPKFATSKNPGQSESKVQPVQVFNSGRFNTRPSSGAVDQTKASVGQSKQNFRKCPFYKKIPNTRICVDAFNYGSIPGCNAYFLSHFHGDHYIGLTKNFPHHIYCSRTTANLVSLKFRVLPQLIHALPLNEAQIIEGVEVTMLDANHCPGSVMLLFKFHGGQAILHTGDFRADATMEMFPQLHSIRISHLFLDTTYCDPTYDFPLQRDVVNFAIEKTLDFFSIHPNTVVAVGTYSIGKERIFLAIAEALGCKILVTRDKKSILTCLEDKFLNERMTSKAADAQLHVLRMNQLNLTFLNDYLESLRPKFDHLLAFEPTGWTHSRKTLSLDSLRPKASSRNVTIYAVPYSEHSSYSEMKRFVQFLCPEKIIPTVNNGNPASRKKMEELFNAWLNVHEEKLASSKKQQMPLSRWLENA